MCYVCVHTSGGWKTTYEGGQFSLFTMWVQGIELRLSGLVESKLIS